MSTPLHVTQSLDDKKKSREMAQARQSGSAPPEMDVKTGSMINPHNPEFITKRPWYLGGGEEGPSLDHQATQEAKQKEELSLATANALVKQERELEKQLRLSGKIKVGMWVEALKKGKRPYRICQVVKVSKKGTEFDVKYEDGFLEKKVRRNKIRVTKTGSRSYKVDKQLHGKETYDSKRDAYHGYEITPQQTKQMEERYAQRDALRRAARNKQQDETKDPKQQKEQQAASDSDSDVDDSDVGSDSDDEFVQRDEDNKTFTSRLARQGGVGGAQMKVTARNLRIREDTAKYLRNLNPNSAYYDPKSRSMRDNPNPNVPTEELQFAGDNFARVSGDAVELAKTQLFAWDAQDKLVSDIHPQANPSQAELLKKEFQSKHTSLKEQQKQAVLQKYGGGEYLDGSSGLAATATSEQQQKQKKTRFGVNVQAEEYTRDGRQVKGDHAALSSKKRVALQSKYQEDVFLNGHTTVWGSYFFKGAMAWGYADDHSLIRNSYGTGMNGRIANDEANELKYGTGVAGSAALAQARQMLKAIPQQERTSRSSARPTSSQLYGEADPAACDLDQDKVQEALEKLKQKEKTDKKRKYNSLSSDTVQVTEEEMEAYRLQKERSDDPMAKFKAE